MRTSIFYLFAVFGLTLAIPTTLDGDDDDRQPCDEQSMYSDQHCCPPSGPCYFKESMPMPVSIGDFRELCGKEVPACCSNHWSTYKRVPEHPPPDKHPPTVTFTASIFKFQPRQHQSSTKTASMRTSIISLFGLVGLALAAELACRETEDNRDYIMPQCCPDNGECTYNLLPYLQFDDARLKSYCGGLKQVATCCLDEKERNIALDCKPIA
ncbi:hypothetical protein V501_04661 [Pseudogymnoascus sp. VKM F-4519 (FW-2642)]|nr:hypothetical protein V501_04661 [Pseudogymnoascus sp. VKM F-4519 (FW-2642)]